MRPRCKAWVGLASGILAYDILCPQGETLSEAVDSALERPVGRYLAMGAVALTGAHLLNILPERYDPFHQIVHALHGKL